jgi:DnaJ-class molecular chaperone
MAPADPYAVLGLPPTADEAQLRAAYRRLVKLHHPDHNGGSAEAAQRFEAVQEAYAEIQRRRAASAASSAAATAAAAGAGQPPRVDLQPDAERRLADLEREVRAAHERAQAAAREAARAAAEARSARAARGADPERPSDEELGYVTTDDSLWKIFADGLDELSNRLGREQG